MNRTNVSASVSRSGTVSILSMAGNITVGEGDVLLRERMKELLDAGSENILLDLSGVRYMDSAGLGELIASHHQLRDRGGRIKLVQPSRRVLALLRVIGLEGVFETYEGIETAVRSCGDQNNVS